MTPDLALRWLTDGLRHGAPIPPAAREILLAALDQHLDAGVSIDRALGLVGAPGQRSRTTTVKLKQRDALVRQLASAQFGGLRKNPTAGRLARAWSKYASSAWPRERLLDDVPTFRVGKPEAVIWQIMKLQDIALSERSIRRILATS